MSRSYKHNVRLKNKNNKYYKIIYNRFLRRFKYKLSNGSSYKKLISYFTYSIYEWNVYLSKKDLDCYEKYKRK